jgi:NADP-dependent 3-hydroxy acid dehydrogenase YdfG
VISGFVLGRRAFRILLVAPAYLIGDVILSSRRPRTAAGSVLITGASSGIGAALARRYARPGIHLALGGRDPDRLAAVAAQCRHSGAAVGEQSVDVTDRAAMAAWIGRVDREASLDLVIANAGTAGQHLPPGPERTRMVFAVNLEGVLNTLSRPRRP